MILWGSKLGENIGQELYSGSKEQCIAWCKTESPADYDYLDILDETGIIIFRIFRNGKPATDFVQLIDK